MIHIPFFRHLFGLEASHSSAQTFSRKHKSLSVESLEDRQMLSISFDPGVVYDYTSENSAVVAPQLGDNRGVFIADFTGDGKNEIIAPDKASVQTFVNNGGTTSPFDSAPVSFMPNSIGIYDEMTVGNLNGDSTPDVVSLATGENSLSIYFWDGRYLKNNTTPSTDIVTKFDMIKLLNISEVSGAVLSMKIINSKIIDATGDGKNDLVCTISYTYSTSAEFILESGRVCVIFRGQGDGTFAALNENDTWVDDPNSTVDDPIVIQFPSLSASATILGVADLYGDSAMEVIVKTSSSTIDIYTVSATGVATKTGTYTHAPGIISVFTGDIDGDNKQELLIYSKVTGQNHQLDIVKLNGNTATQIDKALLTNNPSYLAVGDLDNDGRADILVSNGTAYQVLLQQSNGEFTSQEQIVTVAGYITSVTGDFDGDGIQDVLALGKRVATLIPGDTSKSPSVVLNFSQMDFTPRDFAVGDFDGNGTLDIAVLGGGSGSDIFIFNGTPNGMDLFVKSKELTVTFGTQLLVGQFSTDHAGDDLAVICGSTDQVASVSKISVFKSTEYGLSAAAITSTPNLGYLSSFAVGRLTSDNQDDLVAINSKAAGDTVYVLKCDGTGKFTFTTNVALPSGSVPTAIAIGDMNNDNKNDIVVLLAGQKSVQILTQGSNNQFTAQSAILVSNNVKSTSCTTMELADFDGDGFLDIFVGMVNGTGTNPGSFVVMRNNPDSPGTILERLYTTIPEFEESQYGNLGISLGFLDGNASPDVVLVYNNRVVSYKNQLEFTLDNGSVTLVFRDYDSTKSSSEVSNLSNLNKQKTFLDEWSCFQVEVWANTQSTNGIAEFSCTIQFDATIFEVDSVDLNNVNFIAESGSAFTNFTCTVNGNQVTIAGTLTNSGDLQGDNTNTLLGRIAFIPVAQGGIDLSFDNGYVQAYENGFSVVTASSWLKTTGSSNRGTPSASIHNNVPLFPVVFDATDDGVVSLADLDYFTDAYLAVSYANASASVKEFYYLMDFDFNGSVSLSDLDVFTDNYLAFMTVSKCRSEKISVVYSDDFYDWVADVVDRRALPSATPAALPSTLSENSLDLLAMNSTLQKQDQALVGYLSSLTTTKHTETSFFDELAANQDDVESLLKTGIL